MALGLYKPGQGYWVRVLTATVLGVITLLACTWLWRQVEAYQPPIREWNVGVQGLTQVTPGTPIELRQVSLTDASDSGKVLARGVAASLNTTSSGGHLLVNNLAIEEGQSVGQANRVTAGSGAEAKSASVNSVVGVPSFDKIYVQAAAVGALMLAATIVGFWLIGSKPSSSEFLIATDGEMKKVNWSTRKDILGSTQVVVMWCVLLAAGLFLVDTIFAKFFNLINVLQY